MHWNHSAELNKKSRICFLFFSSENPDLSNKYVKGNPFNIYIKAEKKITCMLNMHKMFPNIQKLVCIVSSFHLNFDIFLWRSSNWNNNLREIIQSLIGNKQIYCFIYLQFYVLLNNLVIPGVVPFSLWFTCGQDETDCDCTRWCFVF